MESAEFSVRWRNHSDELSSVCKNLLDENFLVDCTVTAEGQCLKVHRLILSACSPYFQLMFKQDNEKHPIIFLKDTKFVELKALIDFVYRGEAQIPEDSVEAFFQLAQSLQIKGLNDTAQSNVNKLSEEFVSRKSNPSMSADCFSEGSVIEPQVNLSNYLNRECVEIETNVVQPNNSSKTNLNHTPSYPSDLPTKLVKPNTSLPSEECNDLLYNQVNSPLVTPQQPSSLPVEMPPCVKDVVKSEIDEIEILEPKFEEIYVKMDTGNADDYPENDTEHEELTSGYQMENVNYQTQDDVLQEAEAATSSLIPSKSETTYTKAYEVFCDWRRRRSVQGINEEVMLAFLNDRSKELKPSSLWSYFSMLKKCVKIHEKTDISTYYEVTEFLKKRSEGYKPQKSETLTKVQVTKFLQEADDEQYLLMKIILIFGVFGACRRQELADMTVDNVQDKGTYYRIHVPPTKTDKERSFVITHDTDGFNAFELIKKYLALRPSSIKTKRLFLNFRQGKCTVQPVGINTIGSIPQNIAKYLKLSNYKNYTGHCFRRTSATMLMDRCGDLFAPKNLGGWTSSSVAEYHRNSSFC